MGATIDTARRDAVVEQFFLGSIGALGTLHIHLGDSLGSMRHWPAVPDASPSDLASSAGVAERYARE